MCLTEMKGDLFWGGEKVMLTPVIQTTAQGHNASMHNLEHLEPRPGRPWPKVRSADDGYFDSTLVCIEYRTAAAQGVLMFTGSTQAPV